MAVALGIGWIGAESVKRHGRIVGIGRVINRDGVKELRVLDVQCPLYVLNAPAIADVDGSRTMGDYIGGRSGALDIYDVATRNCWSAVYREAGQGAVGEQRGKAGLDEGIERQDPNCVSRAG